MIIHDEESLEEALLLVEQGPIRYSDEYAYIIVNSPETLKYNVMRAFGRNDIAIVAPVGDESLMEVHHAERLKVMARRRVEEKKGVQEYFREHPERVEKIKGYAEKRGQLEKKGE